MFHHRKLKLVLGTLAASGFAVSLHAQIAQDPLLSRTASVEPSIVFMFDDSSSMPAEFVYQYGGSAGVFGLTGPGGTYAPKSPDINLIYYDPRVKYSRRVNADGTFQVPSATGVPTSWNVYFYKPSTSTTYSVATVPITSKGSGYPSSGVTISFPNAPTGGVRALGSVNMAATKRVISVTMTNGGSYPTGTIGTPTFGGPAPGGQTATGTLQVANSSTVSAIALNNAKTFPLALPAGTVCNWVAAGGFGGTGASGTAVLGTVSSTRVVTSFNIVNGGQGYTSNPTVSVTCGTAPSTVTQNGYTTTRTTRQIVTGVNIVLKGYGYTATPTVTFPAPASAGITATGTVNTQDTFMVDSITVGTPGSGYTSCPTAAQVSLGGSAGDVPAVLGTPTCTSVSTGGVNEKWPGTASPDVTAVGTFFNPFTPEASAFAPGALTSATYPVTASSSSGSYPKFAARTDCAGTTCTAAEEYNNYVTWYRFHRDRLTLAKTGIGLAFQPLNPTFRLGWSQINVLAGNKSSSPWNANNNNLDMGVRLYTSTVQSEFLTWLYSLAGDVGGTPNRTALNKVGNYFKRKDNAGPWGANSALTGSNSTDPNTGTANNQHASCRRAYAMLMTDGYYNDSFSGGSSTWDIDSTSQTVPSTNYAYVPVGPYSDKISGKLYNSFADVAMNFWLNDLRSDLANSVRPTGNDPAFWQHLNFYAIGLGVDGTLDNTDAAVLASLSGSGRTQDWPAITTNDPKAIDDMWHATINGRGKLISAKSSDDLNKAITQMMSDISGAEGNQSGVAVSAAALQLGSRKYTPAYTPVSWNGNVTAFKLNTLGNEDGVAWEIETYVSTDASTGKKTYSSIIPSHELRNIYVGNNAASAPRAVPFTYLGMTGGMRTNMGPSTVVTDDLIKYLRGSKDLEDSTSSTPNPALIYRARDTRLGDIVNSTPVLVRDQVDLLYENLPTTFPGQNTYRQHVNNKKARTEGVLFVGANDGMLHGFRDGTYAGDGTTLTPGGGEVFAYVPFALLPSLKNLSDKTYVHRYYVDGPISESDVYLTSANRWANVILGSTGAGAGEFAVPGSTSPRTAVFAIDTTSLTTSVTGMNASNVLWEVNSYNANFAELGYMLGAVASGVTSGGQWVAIFGNGYESKSCKASLYIVNMADGTRLREIPTNVGSCTAGLKNGLSAVRIVRNASRQIVGVYAGDLQGNLWKFDLSSTSPAAWGVDPVGNPLFAAGSAKPITAPPSILPLPMRGRARSRLHGRVRHGQVLRGGRHHQQRPADALRDLGQAAVRRRSDGGQRAGQRLAAGDADHRRDRCFGRQDLLHPVPESGDVQRRHAQAGLEAEPAEHRPAPGLPDGGHPQPLHQRRHDLAEQRVAGPLLQRERRHRLPVHHRCGEWRQAAGSGARHQRRRQRR